ncbi:MAG: T9SS type A sorting domain-containing protein [Chitinophagaceae bacterium]|nr:MAG: T9SS type A sorting domain-containing protein [Chitinophagaceae bacterium]
MIKGLTVCVLSLAATYCVAQEAAGLPPQSVSLQALPTVQRVPDSAAVITDLVHVIRENSKVVLNWQLTDSTATDFFTIERSSNSRDYEVVAVIKIAKPSRWFEWIDESPAKGKNIYRIKCASKNNAINYSNVIQAQIAGDITFKFYPNPVDNVLIIRSETALDIQIIDATGKSRLSQTNVSGLHTINVSTLEKGVYVIRVLNRLSNTVVQDRLLKN